MSLSLSDRLFNACSDNNIRVVHQLLEVGAVPTSRHLDVSIIRNRTEIAMIFLSMGLIPEPFSLELAVEADRDVLYRKMLGRSLPKSEHLLAACETGSLSIVDILLKYRRKVSFDIDTALEKATRYGFVAIMKLLFPLRRREGEVGLLTEAVSSGKVEAVTALFDEGISPCANNGDAFILAASKGYDSIVSVYLARGMSAFFRENEPLRQAIRGRHLSTVRLLMREGADLGFLTPEQRRLFCAEF